MDQDSFPDEYYMDPDLLLSLRKVGLQSILSWNTIIDCARSIESEGTQGDEQSALSAKARGSELLLFLDMHVDTFFPEFKKKRYNKKIAVCFQTLSFVLFAKTYIVLSQPNIKNRKVISQNEFGPL